MNSPEPKTIYKLSNGHQYKTDDLGRIIEVKGTLKLDPNDRNKYQQGIAGGECRNPDDCGRHLIAAMFQGTGEAINLVPMNGKLNGSGGEWYKLEQSWKEALTRNEIIEVDIKPIYNGISKRPNEFYIQQSINGIRLPNRIIKNTKTGD